MNQPRVHPTGDRGSIPDSDKPKWLERVVTVPLLNGRLEVCVVRVIADDHYKLISCVIVLWHAEELSLLKNQDCRV